MMSDEIGVFFQCVPKEVEERSFQSAKTIVESGDLWLVKGEASGVAFFGKTVDDGPSGIWQSHHLGAFVESFSGGVIDGLTDYFHVEVVADDDELGVAAGNE